MILPRLIVLMLLLWVVNSGAAEPRFVVGFAQDTLANDWRKVQVQEVQAVLAQHPNIQFIVTDAQGQTA
ncbi:MAG: LacI family transcriptional regulator, partial [Marinospirillum sp.]|uniref:hypothetical protein n=1 Tax=Marinospirillum sp. TaxID=2183934 RepID=UPI001A0A7F8D